ncbi:hypothetical protein MXB_1285 [Myxobolus squamalis]|nr:hypothetical protein MXB_1285 [Myxobolus squamalis]
MQKSGISVAEHDSCMQYIGVLSRAWITRFEPKYEIFTIFQSMVFGGEQMTILSATIVTSMISL